MDVLLALLGGGALFGTGTAFGFVLRRSARPRARSSGDAYVCQCKHALSFHDPETSRCQHSKYDSWEAKTFTCRCRAYVGERPLPELDPADVLRSIGEDRS